MDARDWTALFELLERDAGARAEIAAAAEYGEIQLVLGLQALGSRVGARPSRAEVKALLRVGARLVPGSTGELRDDQLALVSGGTTDDEQLAGVDLQSILGKQQQSLFMFSNIAKLLYDTAFAVTHKIGG